MKHKLSQNAIEGALRQNDDALYHDISHHHRVERLDKQQMQQLFALHPLRSSNMNMVEKERVAESVVFHNKFVTDVERTDYVKKGVL